MRRAFTIGDPAFMGGLGGDPVAPGAVYIPTTYAQTDDSGVQFLSGTLSSITNWSSLYGSYTTKLTFFVAEDGGANSWVSADPDLYQIGAEGYDPTSGANWFIGLDKTNANVASWTVTPGASAGVAASLFIPLHNFISADQIQNAQVVSGASFTGTIQTPTITTTEDESTVGFFTWVSDDAGFGIPAFSPTPDFEFSSETVTGTDGSIGIALVQVAESGTDVTLEVVGDQIGTPWMIVGCEIVAGDTNGVTIVQEKVEILQANANQSFTMDLPDLSFAKPDDVVVSLHRSFTRDGAFTNRAGMKLLSPSPNADNLMAVGQLAGSAIGPSLTQSGSAGGYADNGWIFRGVGLYGAKSGRAMAVPAATPVPVPQLSGDHLMIFTAYSSSNGGTPNLVVDGETVPFYGQNMLYYDTDDGFVTFAVRITDTSTVEYSITSNPTTINYHTIFLPFDPEPPFDVGGIEYLGRIIDATNLNDAAACVVNDAGTVLTVVGATRISTYDIETDPANPTLLDSEVLSGAWDIAQLGDHVFATIPGGGSGSILSYDISDPTNITLVDTFTHVESGNLLSGPWMAAVLDDTHIAVTSFSGGRVNIIDVSDPANLAVSGSVSGLPTNSNFGLVAGDGLVFTMGDHTNIYIIDASDPTAPVSLGSESSVLGRRGGFYHNGVLGTIEEGGDRLSLKDTSVLPDMTDVVTDLIDTTAIDFPINMQLANQGNHAVIAASNRMAVVDISDPVNRSIVGYVNDANLTGTECRRIAVNGRYVYRPLLTDGLAICRLTEGSAFDTIMRDHLWYSWLPLDDVSGTTALDVSGNYRNGTYAGTPTFGSTALVTGSQGAAVNFDATTDYVRIPTSNSDPFAAAFTIVFGFSTTRESTSFLVSNAGNDGLNLRLEVAMSATGQTRVDTWTDNSGTYGGPAVNDGQPHLCVVTHEDGDGARLYIDGVLVDHNPGPRDGPVTLLSPSTFLNRRDTGTLAGIGVFDEFAIGNFVMTPEDVQALSEAFHAA